MAVVAPHATKAINIHVGSNLFLNIAPAGTPNAGTVFIPDSRTGTVSVIAPHAGSAATVRVGVGPTEALIAPAGTPTTARTAYVANIGHDGQNIITVIAPHATKTAHTIPVGNEGDGTHINGNDFVFGGFTIAPAGTPEAGTLYIPHHGAGAGSTVSVIAPHATTATNMKVGKGPISAVVAPAGAPNAGTVYVLNVGNGNGHTVSVIAPGATTSTTIAVGRGPVSYAIGTAQGTVGTQPVRIRPRWKDHCLAEAVICGRLRGGALPRRTRAGDGDGPGRASTRAARRHWRT